MIRTSTIALVLLCGLLFAGCAATGDTGTGVRPATAGIDAPATNGQLPPIVREGAWLTLTPLDTTGPGAFVEASRNPDATRLLKVGAVVGSYVEVKTPNLGFLEDGTFRQLPGAWVFLPRLLAESALREATPRQVVDGFEPEIERLATEVAELTRTLETLRGGEGAPAPRPSDASHSLYIRLSNQRHDGRTRLMALWCELKELKERTDTVAERAQELQERIAAAGCQPPMAHGCTSSDASDSEE